jgi:hypothetical protein
MGVHFGDVINAPHPLARKDLKRVFLNFPSL